VVECESHCGDSCSGNARQHSVRRHGRHSPGSSLSIACPAPYEIFNPRNGQPYFNTSLFSPNPLGTGRGDAARRPFYGPGIINFDMALHKVTKLTESKSLEFRLETFNTFNHAQFDGNGSVDGNINDATFGQVVKAAPPRISQVALKLFF
jgi:hypothetical protein